MQSSQYFRLFNPCHRCCCSHGPQNEEAKAAYWQAHGAKESSTGRNKGAHFAYLDAALARNNGGAGYVVGSSLTAGDLCVWEIVDLHLRILKEQMHDPVSGKATSGSHIKLRGEWWGRRQGAQRPHLQMAAMLPAWASMPLNGSSKDGTAYQSLFGLTAACWCIGSKWTIAARLSTCRHRNLPHCSHGLRGCLTELCCHWVCRGLPVLQYPLLVAHHARIAELPGIKEYLASPARLEKVNNNNLG